MTEYWLYIAEQINITEHWTCISRIFLKEKQSLVSIMAVLLMLGGVLFLFIFPDCDSLRAQITPKIISFASIWKVWFFGLWVNPDVKMQKIIKLESFIITIVVMVYQQKTLVIKNGVCPEQKAVILFKMMNIMEATCFQRNHYHHHHPHYQGGVLAAVQPWQTTQPQDGYKWELSLSLFFSLLKLLSFLSLLLFFPLLSLL